MAQADVLRATHTREASMRAAADFADAMRQWQARGDRERAAIAGSRAAETLLELGRAPDAARQFGEALHMAIATPNRLLESDIRSRLGVAESLLADDDGAFARIHGHCATALALAEQHHGRPQAAWAHTCMGYEAYHRQDTQESLRQYGEALRLWTELGDAHARAHMLVVIADAMTDLGQYEEARSRHAEARAVWRIEPDPREEVISLVGEARIHARRGEYQDALAKFEDGRRRFDAMGDAIWEGSSLAGLAEVNLDLGEVHAALKYWERAIAMFTEAGLKNVVVDAELSLGKVYLLAGKDASALATFEQALTLSKELGIPRWTAFALRHIGTVHLVRGAGATAERYLNDSAAVQRSLKGGAGGGLEAETLTDLGQARLLSGDARLAVAEFARALALSKSAENRVAEARARFGMATALSSLGRLTEARAAIEAALRVAESLRTGVENRELRASYVGSVYQWYELHIDILMRMSQKAGRRDLDIAAFEASERARARSLLEGLTREYVRPVSTRENTALRLADIQKMLDRGTLLLEFALGDQRSYLWAVTDTDFRSYILPQRSAIESLARSVHQDLRRDPRQPGGRPRSAFLHDARLLSDVVLQPVAKLMQGRRLAIVADGALQSMPFTSLPLPGRATDYVPVIAEHEVASLPSASVLAAVRRNTLQRPRAAQPIAVFADPIFTIDDPRVGGKLSPTAPGTSGGSPSAGHSVELALRSAGYWGSGVPSVPRLLQTRREADAILQLTPAAGALRATGFAASRARVLSADLRDYRILHFATHAILNDEEPDLSGLLMSMVAENGTPQDGFVRVSDIYGMSLSADLVVLSACETALGKTVRGEGLLGFVRGFLSAGSRRVVASAWKVDDEATAALMRRFYSGMFEKHLTSAAALRAAELDLMSNPEWSEPFYWAAFNVHGDWQ